MLSLMAHPCGEGVDLIRRPYRTLMRLSFGMDPIEVCWFAAPKGAKCIDVPTPFHSRDLDDPHENPDGLGEVWPYDHEGFCHERPYAPDCVCVPYTGHCRVGSDRVWEDGGVVGRDPIYTTDHNGSLPECGAGGCAKVEGGAVGGGFIPMPHGQAMTVAGGAVGGGPIQMTAPCVIWYGMCERVDGGAVGGGALTMGPGPAMAVAGGAVGGGFLVMAEGPVMLIEGGAVGGGFLVMADGPVMLIEGGGVGGGYLVMADGPLMLVEGGGVGGGYLAMFTAEIMDVEGGAVAGGEIDMVGVGEMDVDGGAVAGGDVDMTGGGGTVPVGFVAATYIGVAPGDVTIAVPVGVIDGDVLVATVVALGGGSPPTAPVGWTMLSNGALGFGNQWWLGYRVASSEPGSYTWTVGGGASGYGGMAAYSDGDVPTQYSQDVGNSATMKALSITVAGSDSALYAFYARTPVSDPTTPPGGVLTLEAPADTTQDGQLYVGTGIGAGATGDFDSALTSANFWFGLLVVIPPL